LEQENTTQGGGRRRGVLVIVAACILVGIGVVEFWPSDNEPKYDGKTLSQWLEISRSRRYDDRWAQAEDAVRHIGTNGLPWLIKWMSYDRPQWQEKTAQSKVWRILPRQLYRLVYNREYQTIWAMEGFRILAPTSPPVSSELERLMDGLPERPAMRAWVAVHSLGPAGLPIFFNVATNCARPALVRCVAIDEIGKTFFRVAPPNPAASNLPIVPGLVRCLEEPHSDAKVRAAVTNALHKIAPEVLKDF
jgi:hypothetical protein